jgi:transposase
VGADGKMDVHLDVSTAGYAGRLEVLEGPTGRRVRSEADRARIAAESLMPGVQVAAVARKHGATRWQVYDWRRRLRQGQLALPESTAPMFAPLMVEEPSAPQRTIARQSG